MVKLKQVHKKIKKEAKKLTKQRYIERFHKILIHKHKIPKKKLYFNESSKMLQIYIKVLAER